MLVDVLSCDASVVLSLQPACHGCQSLVSDEEGQCPTQRHHLWLLQQGLLASTKKLYVLKNLSCM